METEVVLGNDDEEIEVEDSATPTDLDGYFTQSAFRMVYQTNNYFCLKSMIL